MTTTGPALAEIQGLYGPFSFAEKLLQKIWLRGDFNRAAAVTNDGRVIQLKFAGKWNLLGGPDFRGARLRFDHGAEVTGDVELHLRAGDWDAHGHARDLAYRDVVLHVVLFPPDRGRLTRGYQGQEIPILALLPLLHHDLEEFAADEAVDILASRPLAGLPEDLAALSASELQKSLREHAARRWQMKTHFARLRLRRLGWEEACHHAALEVLGYRYNRSAMLRVAGRWPLAAWTCGVPRADEAFAAEQGNWSLQGMRPANFPRQRLRQYEKWTTVRPDWPLRWMSTRFPEVTSDPRSTREIREELGFTSLRRRVAEDVLGDALGGSRLHTLICDGLLPLLAVQHPQEVSLHEIWFHWFVGDFPATLLVNLRQLGVFEVRTQPTCHGLAQGLLGWRLAREVRH